VSKTTDEGKRQDGEEQKAGATLDDERNLHVLKMIRNTKEGDRERTDDQIAIATMTLVRGLTHTRLRKPRRSCGVGMVAFRHHLL